MPLRCCRATIAHAYNMCVQQGLRGCEGTGGCGGWVSGECCLCVRGAQASPNSPRHAPGRGWVATRTYFVAVEGEDEDEIEPLLSLAGARRGSLPRSRNPPRAPPSCTRVCTPRACRVHALVVPVGARGRALP